MPTRTGRRRPRADPWAFNCSGRGCQVAKFMRTSETERERESRRFTQFSQALLTMVQRGPSNTSGGSRQQSNLLLMRRVATRGGVSRLLVGDTIFTSKEGEGPDRRRCCLVCRIRDRCSLRRCRKKFVVLATGFQASLTIYILGIVIYRIYPLITKWNLQNNGQASTNFQMVTSEMCKMKRNLTFAYTFAWEQQTLLLIITFCSREKQG